VSFGWLIFGTSAYRVIVVNDRLDALVIDRTRAVPKVRSAAVAAPGGSRG
jgi:hypothetical protein